MFVKSLEDIRSWSVQDTVKINGLKDSYVAQWKSSPVCNLESKVTLLEYFYIGSQGCRTKSINFSWWFSVLVIVPRWSVVNQLQSEVPLPEVLVMFITREVFTTGVLHILRSRIVSCTNTGDKDTFSRTRLLTCKRSDMWFTLVVMSYMKHTSIWIF